MLLVWVCGALALVIGALLCAVRAYAAADQRGALNWLGMSLPFMVLWIGTMWLLLHQPGRLWSTMATGFGPEWHCQTNVPPALRSCFR